MIMKTILKILDFNLEKKKKEKKKYPKLEMLNGSSAETHWTEAEMIACKAITVIQL